MTSACASSLLRPAMLVAGLASALLLRFALAGADAETSVAAGLAFATALAALTVAAGWRPRPFGWRQLAAGMTGAVVICVPAVVQVLSDGSLGPMRWHYGYAPWALAVVIVATAEELFFRGALYTAVRQIGGDYTAVVTGAVLFAAMHVVLNGGQALIVDASVGLWLGVLRMASGSVAAPAIAHVAADLAAWWLR